MLARAGGGTPPMILLERGNRAKDTSKIKSAGRKFDDIQMERNRVIS